MTTLIDKMNAALGWELRAINMYAHYAANVTWNTPFTAISHV